MTVADTRTGNAAWFGTVEEHGEPAYYAMRLRIRGGMITEVETVVKHKPGLPAVRGSHEAGPRSGVFASGAAGGAKRASARHRQWLFQHHLAQ